MRRLNVGPSPPYQFCPRRVEGREKKEKETQLTAMVELSRSNSLTSYFKSIGLPSIRRRGRREKKKKRGDRRTFHRDHRFCLSVLQKGEEGRGGGGKAGNNRMMMLFRFLPRQGPSEREEKGEGGGRLDAALPQRLTSFSHAPVRVEKGRGTIPDRAVHDAFVTGSAREKEGGKEKKKSHSIPTLLSFHTSPNCIGEREKEEGKGAHLHVFLFFSYLTISFPFPSPSSKKGRGGRKGSSLSRDHDVSSSLHFAHFRNLRKGEKKRGRGEKSVPTRRSRFTLSFTEKGGGGKKKKGKDDRWLAVRVGVPTRPAGAL